MFSMYYDEKKERQVVIKTEKYQEERVNEFIKSLADQAVIDYSVDNIKQYTVIRDDDLDPIIFTINTFNYTKLGLQSEYKDFFELNVKEPINEPLYIISPDEETLRGFCGWINRLTVY